MSPNKIFYNLPDKAGVYMMKDSRGKLLYVGKAASLKKRVRNYAQGTVDSKTYALVSKISDVEYVVTPSPIEALILENDLIKKFRPRYNIKLRDDKKYPFIKINTSQDFPPISITRDLTDKKAKYYGPYTDAKNLRRTMRLIKTLFPLRTCKKNINLSKKLSPSATYGTSNIKSVCHKADAVSALGVVAPQRRNKSTAVNTRAYGAPCLNFHMKKCSAPCAGKISNNKYREILKQLDMFLSGRFNRLIIQCRSRMKKFSDRLNFETAARLRDQINTLEKITEKKGVFSENKKNSDYIAVSEAENHYAVQIFSSRDGYVINQNVFIFTSPIYSTSSRIIEYFILQYYNQKSFLPKEILTSIPLENKSLIEKWVEKNLKSRIVIKFPSKGKKAKLVGIVRENAKVKLIEYLNSKKVNKYTDKASQLLTKYLPGSILKKRIEAFDISHLAGENAIGAMVVFDKGKVSHKDYRLFNIRGHKTQDDIAMLTQMLNRRYTRLIKENQKKPCLIIIDGGVGQLNAGLKVLNKLELGGIKVIALAKRLEHVYLPYMPKPVILANNSPYLNFFKKIRDKTHNFAIKNLKKKRSRELRKKFNHR
jgi:excinuclease ABC subunit C